MFVEPQAANETAKYFFSTAPYFDPGTAPDGTHPVIAYKRDGTKIYDLIYYKTEVISNAADYTSGSKKFFMDMYSGANTCTQILIQLESLPKATDNQYPTGRHSRYVAFTTKVNEWERLEFSFLDQPDATVPDNMVNAIALFFNPGSLSNETYYFRNWDSASVGCDPKLSTTCEDHSPNSCFSFTGETGICNNSDGTVNCAGLNCMKDPVCSTSVTQSYSAATQRYSAATSMLRVEGNARSSAVDRRTFVGAFCALAGVAAMLLG